MFDKSDRSSFLEPPVDDERFSYHTMNTVLRFRVHHLSIIECRLSASGPMKNKNIWKNMSFNQYCSTDYLITVESVATCRWPHPIPIAAPQLHTFILFFIPKSYDTFLIN